MKHLYNQKNKIAPSFVIRSLKTPFLFLLLFISSLKSFAQPPNDDPCNAININPASTCTFQNFTTTAATATAAIPDPGCADYLGGDVWFKATVPCSGSLVFATQAAGMYDAGMAIYSGTCNNLTLIECEDYDPDFDDMPSISRTDLVPGTTVWVRIWADFNDNQGSFGLCISIPPPAGPGGSCSSAAPFCTSNVYTFSNNTNVPQLGGSGIYDCLLTTPNPVFFYMQIETPGDLFIHIVQTSSSGGIIDVDYACWGPFVDLASSCGGLTAANNISCSYSSSGDETAHIANAQVGEFYVLLLTNYSNLPGTITFQQSGGPASTSCAVICNINAGNSGPVCPGQSFNLTSSLPAGLPGATYSWTGPDCFISNAQNPSGIIASSTPGNYVYTVTATTPSGSSCTTTTTLVVGGLSGSTAAVTNPTCPGLNDGVITATPPASGGPFVYTLNIGLATEVIQPGNPVFPGLAPGNYTVTVTNPIGCSETLPVVVPPGLALIGSSVTTATSCPGVNDGTITVTPPATGGPFTYTLDPASAAPVIQVNNPVFTNVAAGGHTITFTNAAGCNGAVSPAPVVIAGAALTPNPPTVSNPPCSNINDGVITIVPSVPGTYTYILNPGLPSELDNGNNPTFPNLAPGNYSYSFTNAIGCVGTGNTSLTTHSPLTTTVSKTMPLCNGNANGIVTLNASGGVAPYQYALSPFTVYHGGTFNGLIAGIYTFRIKDDVGCTKDTTITLSEPALLTAVADSTDGTCNGNDGKITVTGSGGTPAYTYSIDNGVTYQASPVFIVSGGNYPNIRIKDNNGCVANTSIHVLLIDNMVLIPANDTTICIGQSVTFHPQVSTEASIFNWRTIPDPSLISTLDNDTIKNATATPLDTTIYILNAKWGVCLREDTIRVNILHKPIPYAGKDTAVCYDRNIAILHGSASNLSGSVSYLWTDTTNLQTPHTDITVATPPLTETFTLTVTDNYGCNFSVTDDITVTVQPPVPAFAGNDTIAVLGQPHQLMASGGVAYVWSPAYPLNLSTIQNPLATLDHDQQFTVVVTDDAGCVGNDTVYIQVYEGPAYHVPNAFSPNGDGLNDIFRVIPAGIAYTEWFRVFNRYGELVFETNKWLKGWDGTYLGKKQPVGNYVWTLKGVNKYGRVVEMKGTVLLVH